MLSAPTISSSDNIQGSVIIYLKNGEALQLGKTTAKDYVDNKSVVLYSLTSTQIKTLSNSNISTIRYSIANSFNKEGFTANNIGYDTKGYPDANESTSTAQEIRELFK